MKVRQLKKVEVTEADATIATEEAIVTIMAEA
jgi:hypothetical protein